MIRVFAIAASILLFTAVPMGAASSRVPLWQDASQSQSPAQSPASAASTPSPNSSASTSSSKPKSKKTWTNDNVSDATGAISVVGSANSASPGGKGPKASPKTGSSESLDPRVVASLRDQLHRLQTQLVIVNKQYSDLKAQSKGEAKSAGGLQANTFNYDSSSVEEQLRRLQEKKKRLEEAIDQLLDAARKAGIEPGELR